MTTKQWVIGRSKEAKKAYFSILPIAGFYIFDLQL
jgi:hypothetical protein